MYQLALETVSTGEIAPYDKLYRSYDFALEIGLYHIHDCSVSNYILYICEV